MFHVNVLLHAIVREKKAMNLWVRERERLNEKGNNTGDFWRLIFCKVPVKEMKQNFGSRVPREMEEIKEEERHRKRRRRIEEEGRKKRRTFTSN